MNLRCLKFAFFFLFQLVPGELVYLFYLNGETLLLVSRILNHFEIMFNRLDDLGSVKKLSNSEGMFPGVLTYSLFLLDPSN